MEPSDPDGPGECICTLDGISVTVPGGPGDPGPPPDWPDPPGWPYDPINWDVPPSGWPTPPAPGPGECDPHGILDPCDFTATVRCSSNVVRGTTGGCELEVPAHILDYVVRWTFRGDSLSVDLNANTPSWQGTLIESGRVKVEFVAMGRATTAISDIVVRPRTASGWEWGVGQGITIDQGGMSWPGISDGMGHVCRPGQACPLGLFPGGWLVQPNSGIAPGNGYTIAEVTSGPNEGGWYVSNVSMNLHMVSLINPDLLPGGPLRTASGVHASACGSSAPDTMVTTVEYNEDCRGIDMAPVAAWAGAHEAIHMANAVGYVQADRRWDPRAVVANEISTTSSELSDHINTLLEHIPVCVQRAAGTHDRLQGMPGIVSDTWWWYLGTATFGLIPQGLVWWEDDDDDPDPFASPCG